MCASYSDFLISLCLTLKNSILKHLHHKEKKIINNNCDKLIKNFKSLDLFESLIYN